MFIDNIKAECNKNMNKSNYVIRAYLTKENARQAKACRA